MTVSLLFRWASAQPPKPADSRLLRLSFARVGGAREALCNSGVFKFTEELFLRITAALMTVSLLFRWASAQQPKPQPIAIYYGYPSLVNGAKGDLDKAARAFDAYSIFVI